MQSEHCSGQFWKVQVGLPGRGGARGLAPEDYEIQLLNLQVKAGPPEFMPVHQADRKDSLEKQLKTNGKREAN